MEGEGRSKGPLGTRNGGAFPLRRLPASLSESVVSASCHKGACVGDPACALSLTATQAQGHRGPALAPLTRLSPHSSQDLVSLFSTN